MEIYQCDSMLTSRKRGIDLQCRTSAEPYEPGSSALTEVVQIRFKEQVTWIHQTFVKLPSKMETTKVLLVKKLWRPYLRMWSK